MGVHKYYCKTWFVPVEFHIGMPWDRFAKDIKRRHECKIVKVEGCTGKTLMLENRGDIAIVVWTLRKDIDVIAHECLHAVNYILENRGVQASWGNDEAQAYLLTELIGEALRAR